MRTIILLALFVLLATQLVSPVSFPAPGMNPMAATTPAPAEPAPKAVTIATATPVPTPFVEGRREQSHEVATPTPWAVAPTRIPLLGPMPIPPSGPEFSPHNTRWFEYKCLQGQIPVILKAPYREEVVGVRLKSVPGVHDSGLIFDTMDTFSPTGEKRGRAIALLNRVGLLSGWNYRNPVCVTVNDGYVVEIIDVSLESVNEHVGLPNEYAGLPGEHVGLVLGPGNHYLEITRDNRGYSLMVQGLERNDDWVARFTQYFPCDPIWQC